VVTYVRRVAADVSSNHVGTVGRIELGPNRDDMVAGAATLAVDLRDTDDSALAEAEARLDAFVADLAGAEGVEHRWRRLARTTPVAFDPAVADRIVTAARRIRRMRMPADLDQVAPRVAPVCPTGVILLPRADGDGAAPAPRVHPDDMAAGAGVLLDVLTGLGG
jgi:beta-ureidopropionase / N-carbamoyl-L-amino-acid hydrolase